MAGIIHPSFIRWIMMKRFFLVFLLSISILLYHAYAGDTSVVSVSGVVLSKSECKFNSKTASLSFGNLDPSNPVDRTVSTAITFRCGGSAPMATFSITDDDGLYETGPDQNRMKHTTIPSEYLLYNLTLNPTSGTVPKNTNQTLTITGTVKGVDYQDAPAGNYSDTVVISIEP
ncbi:MAG: spore coat protein U domain-containing protein [Thermodesulfobacteriota bacterium]